MKKLILYLCLLCSLPLTAFEVVCEERSLFDAPISIVIRSCIPQEKVSVVLSTRDSRGEKWHSEALFKADEKGVVDLTRDAPLKGSYSGVEPMALFYQMTGQVNKPHFPKFSDSIVSYDLSINGKFVKRIERVLCTETVVRKEIKERGIVATLFLPKSKHKLPLILSITGANGGVSEKRASLLASHGFATLAIGYFGVAGLPSTLQEIPLEYFESIFAWVEMQDYLSGEMALFGTSRGGELSLLLASLYPDKFKAVAVTVPSSISWGGLVNPKGPAWTKGGKAAFPFLTPAIPDFNKLGGKTPSDPLVLSPYLADALKNLDNSERASIPVERIRADLLLISAGDDQMWPSELFCRAITKRLQEKRSPVSYQHVDYPKAGHGISLPFAPSATVYFHPVFKRFVSNGGSIEADQEASYLSWNEILSFFGHSLKVSS